MKMTIKKGDSVLIISGKDKGKQGEVIRVIPATNRVVVAGVNIRKHHLKPSKTQPRGGIVELPGTIHRSNVKSIDAGEIAPAVQTAKPAAKRTRSTK